jgi:glucokinase
MSETSAQKRAFVGVDIGGTKVAAGQVDADGEIGTQIRVPMISHASAEEGLGAVLQAIAQILPSEALSSGDQQVAGIGICAPGPLDPTTGVILNPPNVPCWRDFPLADEVRKVYRVPVRVDNDANGAALAEARWGAGRGYPSVFYATIGTGIGTGIIFDGRIFHGRTGAAGEGGHVSIDYHGPLCKCGKPGCIEVFASGTAIGKRARQKIADGGKSSMPYLAGGNLDAVTGEIVGKAFAAGDPLATEILTETADMVALWLGNMIDLLDPHVIVIGGGAAALIQPFFDRIRKRIPKLTVNPRSSEVPIVSSRYGADSGIAGGAALCA